MILDDLSYVWRDQAETSVLFELIAERYEHKSLVITANTLYSQWGEVFVEPAIGRQRRERQVEPLAILVRPGGADFEPVASVGFLLPVVGQCQAASCCR